MRKIFLFSLVSILLTVGSSYGATKFLFEDFEDQAYLDSFVSSAESYCNTLNSITTVVPTAPYAGTYCAEVDLSTTTIGRINFGQVNPYDENCGTYTQFQGNYTNEFAVRFRIKYHADLDFGVNCRKILRIKGTLWGNNGLFTWSQYGTWANIFLGDEAYSYGGTDTRSKPYTPPRNEWILITVYMDFNNDTILVRATDSGGKHTLYNGTYFNKSGAGYNGARPTYITIVGARCGTAQGAKGLYYLDDIEIWDGLPIHLDPPTGLKIVE